MAKLVTVQIDPELMHYLETAWGYEEAHAEVVMVLPRPKARVLVITKPFYPPRTFRLPTGGVQPGETPEAAFRRETLEETGLHVEIEAKIAEQVHRCVAGSDVREITSHIFLGSATSDAPHPIDEAERLSGYAEVGPQGLRALARNLENLTGPWQGWGAFRAPAHEVVAGYLECSSPDL